MSICHACPAKAATSSETEPIKAADAAIRTPSGFSFQKTVTAPARPAEARPNPSQGALISRAVIRVTGASNQSAPTMMRSANLRCSSMDWNMAFS